ncbi:hypothetical protein QJS10_CPA09g00963 [Acorus calamus]|uniref:Uncharacterized protein n=1 Tax=Acorus calamus TaxID=4465 RepID=A0AAV9EAZ1_ACOCL|nr:hypothetical protein QJS10_CPA09g00963 [Acorus calamus]
MTATTQKPTGASNHVKGRGRAIKFHVPLHSGVQSLNMSKFGSFDSFTTPTKAWISQLPSPLSWDKGMGRTLKRKTQTRTRATRIQGKI